MADATQILDRQLTGLDRVLLTDGGSVRKKTADIFAHKEYEKYKAQERLKRYSKADKAIQEIAKEAKALTKK